MMHGISILHTIISSVARNGNTGRTFSQRTLYTIQRISIPPHCHFERSREIFFVPFFPPPSLSRLREALPHLFAIRCFPFFAIKHSPSYRQRKRSLGCARDDDTGRTRFPHILSLHDARDIHSLHCHFERSEKSSLHSVVPCSFR